MLFFDILTDEGAEVISGFAWILRPESFFASFDMKGLIMRNTDIFRATCQVSSHYAYKKSNICTPKPITDKTVDYRYYDSYLPERVIGKYFQFDHDDPRDFRDIIAEWRQTAASQPVETPSSAVDESTPKTKRFRIS